MSDTVFGASVGIFSDAGVLLVKRGRPPFEGLWSLPGGRLEPGEMPVEAACREVEEETGLRIVPLGPPLRYRIPDTDRILAVFAARLPDGAPEALAASDAAAVRWVPLTGVAALPHTDGLPEVCAALARKIGM